MSSSSSPKRPRVDQDGQHQAPLVKSPSKKGRSRENSFSTAASLQNSDKQSFVLKENSGGGSSVAPPKYGEQDYWEERYKILAKKEKQQQKVKEDNDEDAAPLPYHSWYFTFDELRPILMPLILGGQTNEMNEAMDGGKEEEGASMGDESNESDELGKPENKEAEREDDKESTGEEEKNKTAKNKGKNSSETNGKKDPVNSGEEEEFVEVIDSSDDEGNNDEDRIVFEDDTEDEDGDEESLDRGHGLAEQGPIHILEIGCGDVPLGVGLAQELHELQQPTGAEGRTIAKQILCVDYSSSVIDQMKKQHSSSKLLKFEVADARNMSIESASQHLILEKGTLDAMLSDPVGGVKKCHDTLAECARVLAVNGCLVLISHWNANAEKGLQWLHDVVFEGLNNKRKKKNAKDTPSHRWDIEVHGNAEEVKDDDDDDDDDDGEDKAAVGGPGPAVYIIHKRPFDINEETAKNVQKEEEEIENIMPIRFFSY